MKNENNEIKTLTIDNVTVEMIKEGNLVTIKIKGEPEVILNENTIYSPQDKKEYRFLPHNLVPFIQKYEEYINEEDDHFDIDLCIEGKTITIYIPKNKNKRTFVARYDTSEDDALTRLEEEYEFNKVDIEKFKMSRDTMINELKNLGYKLKYSHSQDEFVWCWSDINFSIKDFNEEEFIKVSKIIIEHDKIIRELYDLY